MVTASAARVFPLERCCQISKLAHCETVCLAHQLTDQSNWYSKLPSDKAAAELCELLTKCPRWTASEHHVVKCTRAHVSSSDPSNIHISRGRAHKLTFVLHGNVGPSERSMDAIEIATGSSVSSSLDSIRRYRVSARSVFPCKQIQAEDALPHRMESRADGQKVCR